MTSFELVLFSGGPLDRQTLPVDHSAGLIDGKSLTPHCNGYYVRTPKRTVVQSDSWSRYRVFVFEYVTSGEHLISIGPS